MQTPLRKLQKGALWGHGGDCMRLYLRTLPILIINDVSQLRNIEKACTEFYHTSNPREWRLDLPMGGRGHKYMCICSSYVQPLIRKALQVITFYRSLQELKQLIKKVDYQSFSFVVSFFRYFSKFSCMTDGMNDFDLLKGIYVAICNPSLQAAAQEPPQDEQSNDVADCLTYARMRLLPVLLKSLWVLTFKLI